MAFTTQASHINHGQSLFETGLFADCTIFCQKKSWKLHRAVLTPRCDFFRACFTSGFQESTSSNGGISISMHDDEPQALDRMLRWIYTFSYPTTMQAEALSGATAEDQNVVPDNFWTTELNLCITANKYSMVQLLTDAASSILDTARQSMSDPDSAKHCLTFITHLDDFVSMLETLFTDASLPNLPFDLQVDLLEIMGDMIAKHIGREERLSELMAEVPAFGVMLVQVLGSSSSESDSDTTDASRETSPHVSTSTRLISARRGQIKRRQRRSSSQTSSSSEDANVSGRLEDVKIRGHRQPTVVARRVHIPMNEDSDLE